jgi:CAAX prenyl protease-like protein
MSPQVPPTATEQEPSPWPFILPLVVFLAITMLEPRFSGTTTDELPAAVNSAETRANDEYERRQQNAVMIRYCVIYAIKIVAAGSLLFAFASVYRRQFPPNATGWSIIAGLVGVVLWIGLCSLGIEATVLAWFGAEAPLARSQFNPFELPAAWQQAVFLALRFTGLVLLVPVCEELFLRGFLMRYVQSPEWWRVSLYRPLWRAALVAPLYGALTHPGEVVAAVVWFSLVTLLVARTGKFWDAVIAHAVTNLALGVYVCAFGQWHLW